MIRSKQPQAKDKKVHPIIGLLLFLISVLLLLVTGPLGFLYGLLHSLFTAGLKGLGEYLLKIAVSIDQLGNVMMQHLLNALWVKKNGYQFGNRDETISSALGRNKQLGTLTAFGKLIDRVLDIVDPNHSLNSIDYYIEPRGEPMEELAWIFLRDRHLLCIRDAGSHYTIPSAAKHPGETDRETLYAQVRNLLKIELEIAAMEVETVVQLKQPGSAQIRRKTCYRSEFRGNFAPSDCSADVAWLGYADQDAVEPLDQLVFDYLHSQGKLA